MRYPTVLVIGGSGFVGSSLVARLSNAGHAVIVPTRNRERAKALITLPTVDVVEADVHDDAVLRGLMQGADAVVNLVGILHSRAGAAGTSYGPDFERAHVVLPKRIVAACVASGVSRYLHMSALGADANGPSMYQRSKAAGELVARSEPSLKTTIFRPSVVFGAGDHFLNMFASMQRILPLVPLGGAEAKFQPIHVEDVARAFVNALACEQTIGRTYELAGPMVYSLRQLVQLAGLYAGYPRPVIGLPPSLARLQALLLEYAPFGPIMSRDNLASMQVDNVAKGGTTSPIAPELGITPAALEAIAPQYLSGRFPRARYDDYRTRAHR
ncbi:MAG: complex I NDUFA9 subunit family protein [Glaciimonas sp.]|nr:complex I NDUFA9 subunit family protein [Glaciimonas sp.]